MFTEDEFASLTRRCEKTGSIMMTLVFMSNILKSDSNCNAPHLIVLKTMEQSTQSKITQNILHTGIIHVTVLIQSVCSEDKKYRPNHIILTDGFIFQVFTR